MNPIAKNPESIEKACRIADAAKRAARIVAGATGVKLRAFYYAGSVVYISPLAEDAETAKLAERAAEILKDYPDKDQIKLTKLNFEGLSMLKIERV